MNFVFSLLIEIYLSVRCPVCSSSHTPCLGEHHLSRDPNPSSTPSQHFPKVLEYLSPFHILNPPSPWLFYNHFFSLDFIFFIIIIGLSLVSWPPVLSLLIHFPHCYCWWLITTIYWVLTKQLVNCFKWMSYLNLSRTLWLRCYCHSRFTVDWLKPREVKYCVVK